MTDINHYLSQMQRYGVRRLLVMSGHKSWCYEQALKVSEGTLGDWLWLSPRVLNDENNVHPMKAKTLLGREFKHAVFDAREGFNAEAFAILAGTLVAGSVLILLLPAWSEWRDKPDVDSLRWIELAEPISTPNFVDHFKRILLANQDVLLWRQGRALDGELLSERPDWQLPDGQPTLEQQQLLTRLANAEEGVYVLTAGRGRGKSAVAGMLANSLSNQFRCWLTAPNKTTTTALRSFIDEQIVFFAPDALLEHCKTMLTKPDIDWLIIDEAAAIPTTILYQLISFFPRVLLTTTIQGYEGTGRGFMLKFCSNLPVWTGLTLNQPIRWASNDPLEKVADDFLLMQTEHNSMDGVHHLTIAEPMSIPSDQISINPVTQAEIVQSADLLTQFYGLLTSAHYRTTPLDLRRLLDAPNMHFSYAMDKQKSVVGAVWAVNEGGIDQELALDIWAGRRRPKGNLVAQSLAAHAGIILAPQLRSIRISRIAVQTHYRRQGIAKRLIQQQIDNAKRLKLDYVSVSFGYTPELFQFWHSNGFILVHVGSHKEASSGCYAAMALVPLSSKGQNLVQIAQQRLQRNWSWMKSLIPLSLPVDAKHDEQFNADDWVELIGFAFSNRQPEASHASLGRLLHHTPSACRALRLQFESGCHEVDIIAQLRLTGRNDLIRLWRKEAALALKELNRPMCDKYRKELLQQNAADDE